MIHIFQKAAPLRTPFPVLARRLLSDKPSDDKPEKPDKSVEQKPTAKAADATAAPNRLNELLASISKDSNLNLVKTVVAPKPKTDKRATKKNKHESKRPASAAEEAARDVAQSLGGDVQKTESELLAKLLKRSPDAADVSIGDLISGMQIDRAEGKSKTPKTRSQFVRKNLGDQQRATQRQGDGSGAEFQRERFQRRQPSAVDRSNVTSVNLFGEKPLGIFADLPKDGVPTDVLTTWSALQQRELSLAVTHPPSNYFQKMALWTEQGKLWKFPIDNEQGLDDEAAICFTEHIFLDRHLEGWCPARGPIRHFMELVCVGLSKNPYYTVQQKIDHINWFRDYFDEKKELLEQVIVQAEPSAPTSQVQSPQ